MAHYCSSEIQCFVFGKNGFAPNWKGRKLNHTDISSAIVETLAGKLKPGSSADTPFDITKIKIAIFLAEDRHNEAIERRHCGRWNASSMKKPWANNTQLHLWLGPHSGCASSKSSGSFHLLVISSPQSLGQAQPEVQLTRSIP
jgi:hypothetical protein